jgi:hypothetical protein
MKQNDDVSSIRQAWQAAAQDLGIRVETSDCWLEQDGGGSRHELVAIVRDFGGENGMAILGASDPALRELAASHGFGFTVLGPSYNTYERRLFEDTLNDWQWTGEGEAPPWYTGRPWTS